MITIKFDSRLLLNLLSPDISVEMDGHYVIIQTTAGKSVNQVLRDFNIQLSQAVTAVVNGQTTDLEEPLREGDEVRLLPQIAGGD
jgi:molybdopterin converting factor small subunit